jgi:hypothetical protein
MRKLLLLIGLFFFTLNLFSQEKAEMIVFGRITDAAGNPIEGVYISDINSTKGTVSDIKGFYELNLPDVATTIKYSYVGFKIIEKPLSPKIIKKAQDKRILINIQLVQETYELTAPEISGKPYEWVYQNPYAWVTDYEFISDSTTLLLMMEQNDHFLKIINDDGKVLLEYPIQISNANFYRDCIGNIHLLSQDSAYQIYIFDTMGIYMYPAISIKLFNEKLLPCAYANDEDLFWMNYNMVFGIISYIRINKDSKHQSLLFSNFDKDNYIKIKKIVEQIQKVTATISSLNDFPEYTSPYVKNNYNNALNHIAELGYDPRPEYDDFGNTNNKAASRHIEKLEKLYVELDYYLKPVEVELFEINGSVYIFDYLNYEVRVFGSDTSKHQTMIVDRAMLDLHHCDITNDYEHQRIFAFQIKNGIACLNEISPSDLSIKPEFKISEHVYPQKVKIRGDYIYYLYGGVVNEQNKYLFREKIK